MNTQKDYDNGPNRSEQFEEFPEPQTIPLGWDLSEILSTYPDSLAKDAEGVTEA